MQKYKYFEAAPPMDATDVPRQLAVLESRHSARTNNKHVKYEMFTRGRTVDPQNRPGSKDANLAYDKDGPTVDVRHLPRILPQGW